MQRLVVVALAILLLLVQITPVPARQDANYAAFLGPSGGFEGKEISDPGIVTNKITAVGVRSGDYIDGIEVHTIPIDHCTEKQYEQVSQVLGGSGGKLTWLRLECDEYINIVRGTYAEFVDSLTITTTKGQTMTWGGSGGVASFVYEVPPEIGSILGFWGRFGEYVNAIGVTVTYKWSE